jgi:hypothetical protein
MTDSMALQPLRLPTFSFAPFRLLEAVPWLMLAAAMRILAYMGGAQAILAYFCAWFAILLAFLLAARRMIELTDGRTGLGRLGFVEQLGLARKVMVPVILVMVGTAILVGLSGATVPAMHLLLGFDGMAFDQATYGGMAWSAVLAAVTLMMLLRTESGRGSNLFAAFGELWQRSACMVPAIMAVAIAHIGLNAVQGFVRVGVYAYWNGTATPQIGRTLVLFFFIFGFASVRLWITLAILTYGLRASYRRGDAVAAAP